MFNMEVQLGIMVFKEKVHKEVGCISGSTPKVGSAG